MQNQDLRSLVNNDNFEAVRNQIEAGIDINKPDKSGQTPLFWACRKNSLRVAEVLINAGACVTIRDEGSNATFDWVKSPEMYLLLARAWPQDHPRRLHVLAAANLADEVAGAVAAGADVDARDGRRQTPLFWAIQKGSLAAAEVLVEAGADVNSTFMLGTALIFEAIKTGSLAAVELLIEAGADVTVQNFSQESTLDRAKSPEMRQLLARAWPRDDPLRLHALAKVGLADEVVDAVAAGADVNARGQWGRTPLFWAIQKDSLAAATALLAGGVDVSAECYSFDPNPMELAKSPEMHLLLARAWPQDHPLRLHALAKVDLVDEVVDAVAAGADVNARDEKGRTPLFWAIKNNSMAVTEVLIEAGADVSVCDNDGQSPKDLLKTPEMASLLDRA